ncbi:MAG: reverse transcriptase N-terminal domain-containing protein [Limnospira maxima]
MCPVAIAHLYWLGFAFRSRFDCKELSLVGVTMTQASLKKGFQKSNLIQTCVRMETNSLGKSSEESFQAQKRIFQAAKSGQDAKARKLQRLLVKSYYARLLAVRL